MLENIRLSFQGIWSHKMRSFLTMLGIIIGIAAIIAIVSTIQGTNEQIKQNLIGSGTNAVKIQLYNGNYTMDLTYEQLPESIPVISQEVKDQILALDEVASATLYHERNEYEAIFYLNSTLTGARLIGADQDYMDVFGYRLFKGRGFSDSDYRLFRKVCLLDEHIVASGIAFRSIVICSHVEVDTVKSGLMCLQTGEYNRYNLPLTGTEEKTLKNQEKMGFYSLTCAKRVSTLMPRKAYRCHSYGADRGKS